jgi:DNA invertase Pin-like site-specific DNA recombinase
VAAVYSDKIYGTGWVVRKDYERLLKEGQALGRSWTHLLIWSLDRFSREATFTKATLAVLDLEVDRVRLHP